MTSQYEKTLEVIQKTKNIRILIYELIQHVSPKNLHIKEVMEEIDQELNELNTIEKEVYYNYLNHQVKQMEEK